MIPGNTNTYTVVEQRLDPPVLATKIRVVPYSEHVRTVCMRVELVGYRWQGKYHLFLCPHVYSDWVLVFDSR
jgi:discoidin domain receptor family protein 2